MSHRSIGLLLLLLGACADPAPLQTPSAIVLRIAEGDAQEAPIREYAPLTLVVQAVDATGVAQAGLPVTWSAVVNGEVTALNETTAVDGRAEARFRFGDLEGPAEVIATVPGGGSVRFALRAAPPAPGIPYDTMELLAFSTYEGTGETVHPDYARTPWNGLRNLLAITPYPGGNSDYENPSLFAGRSPLLWPVPTGVVNPLAQPSKGTFLSDPDLVFVPEADELRLYYRSVDTQNHMLVMRSKDGIRWGPPREVESAPNHRLISPAVVYRGPGDWWMWSIDGGKEGCSALTSGLELRRSTDGLHWGRPVAAPLEHDGFTPWHIDVQWIPSRRQFWAVYNGKLTRSCTTPALFLATSPDGIVWTPIREPLVRKGAIPAFQDVVYRSTFRYDAGSDDLWLWISGARFDFDRWTWSTALQRRHGNASLLATPSWGSLDFERPPALLTEWP
jgi:hypothetical protein